MEVTQAFRIHVSKNKQNMSRSKDMHLGAKRHTFRIQPSVVVACRPWVVIIQFQLTFECMLLVGRSINKSLAFDRSVCQISSAFPGQREGRITISSRPPNLEPGADSMIVAWFMTLRIRHPILGLPSPFFPGILLFWKPSKTQRTQRNSWFLKRTMVEKNGQGINP